MEDGPSSNLLEALFEKVHLLEKRLNLLTRALRQQQNLDLRARMRWKTRYNKQFNIILICHRPAIWGFLQSVWERFHSDDRFSVTIVTVPGKEWTPDQGLAGETYSRASDDRSWHFFKDFPCRVLRGFNAANEKWLNLENLEPDVVFYQSPYDVLRPDGYKSSVVSGCAYIGYVHYGIAIGDENISGSSLPLSFAANTSLFFAETTARAAYIKEIMKEPFNPRPFRIDVTGYPGHDDIQRWADAESPSWHFPCGENFRVLWTPRWTERENNCHFREYDAKLLDYAATHSDVELLFRPHPQAFREYVEQKVMTREELDARIARYEQTPNASIDQEKTYYHTLFSSDVLISDFSSLMFDYMLTGKPIIYCHKTDQFNAWSRNVAEGFYRVHTWEELQTTLTTLKNGHDPLKERRREIIAKEYYLPEPSAAEKIVELTFSWLTTR